MRELLVCALAASVLALAGCAVQAANQAPDEPGRVVIGGPMKVGEAANGTEVPLESGQMLEIALKGNITTGYDWALDGALPSQVTTVTDEYVSDTGSPGVAGAGGTHTFIYEAVASGTGTLKLKYRRSFEPKKTAAQTFTITVVVP
jgi:inhibitor of cysteine peptidase